MTGKENPKALSASEEARLVREAQSSNYNTASKAYERLENQFDCLISSYARRIVAQPNDAEDVRQDLRIAFFHAIKNFDGTKGARLATYAMPWLEGSVKGYRRSLTRSKDTSLEALLDGVGDGEGDNPYLSDDGFVAEQMIREIILSEVVVPVVGDFVANLPVAQSSVAEHLFFMNHSQREAAESLGISQQAVSRSLQRILAEGRRKLAPLALAA